MRSSALWFLPLLGLAWLPRASDAQVVTIEHVANVGDTTGGQAYLAQLADLLVLDDGRIVVSDRGNPPVRIFDAVGEFSRTLGRLGQGPGEYSPGPVLVDGMDAGIELFSRGRRITYSAELEALTTQQFSAPLTTLEMTRVGAFYVRARPLRTAQSVGLPIHLFSREGEFVRSFGADPPIRDVREFLLFTRRFAPSSDSTFWSADLLRFRLQHWRVDGSLINEIEREPDWFPPQDDIGIDPRDGPLPRISAIAWDPAAVVVWVATLVAREGWESTPTRAELGTGIGQPVVDSQRDRELVYRTIVEALDPRTGAVLGSGEIPALVTGISNGRYAYAEGRAPDGQPVARVWRLTIQR